MLRLSILKDHTFRFIPDGKFVQEVSSLRLNQADIVYQMAEPKEPKQSQVYYKRAHTDRILGYGWVPQR